MWELTTKILGILSFLALTHCYELGVTYVYQYETRVTLHEKCDEAIEVLVGHRFRGKVGLTSIWQNSDNSLEKLIKIEVLDLELNLPKKSTFDTHTSDANKLVEFSSYVQLIDGSTHKIFEDPSESLVLRNIKRGIISNFLQLKLRDQQLRESDLAGNCHVNYQLNGNSLTKTKQDCTHPSIDNESSKKFGFRSVAFIQNSQTKCELSKLDSYLTSTCTAEDEMEIFSNIWRESTICIRSRSNIQLVDQSSGEKYSHKELANVLADLKANKKGNLEEGNLAAFPISKQADILQTLANSVKSYHESLKTASLAKTKSASAFQKLVSVFRSATKEDLKKVLTNKKYKLIKPQLLDIMAACATENALEVIFETFQFNNNYDELLERYLISLSVSPRPSESVLKKIMSILDKKNVNEKIKATLASALGSLLKTYAQKSKEKNQLVLEVSNYLQNQLKQCDKDECKLMFLRGIRNAAQPNMASILLEFASKGGKPALEALRGLRIIPTNMLPPDSILVLEKIFHEIGQRQDRSARAMAAEIMLNQHPNRNILKGIASSLIDQTDPEFSTFMMSKLHYMMSTDTSLKLDIEKVLLDKDIGYYYSMAQNGASSLFKRQLFSASGVNVTYGIEMEMLKGGLLKRSSFDVDIQSEAGGNTHLLSVEMFGEGLSSMAGVSSSDEEETPTAGMELAILGSALRPYVFFTGTSELMSHAWSGTASELTPALQGNFALFDDEQTVILSNGMTVHLSLNGVLSTDLSAAIQISLWNRNSQSTVKNAVALLVKVQATVVSGIAENKAEFSFDGQSAIDFNTDLDFYESPFKMCLQMSQPDILFRRNFYRSTTIPGTKYLVKKLKKRKRSLAGRSYALHRRNDDQCREMANNN